MASYHLREREQTAYPSKAQITRTVQAARATGLNVASVDVQPDGTIRVSSTPVAAANGGHSLFDQLNEAGKL